MLSAAKACSVHVIVLVKNLGLIFVWYAVSVMDKLTQLIATVVL